MRKTKTSYDPTTKNGQLFLACLNAGLTIGGKSIDNPYTLEKVMKTEGFVALPNTYGYRMLTDAPYTLTEELTNSLNAFFASVLTGNDRFESHVKLSNAGKRRGPRTPKSKVDDTAPVSKFSVGDKVRWRDHEAEILSVNHETQQYEIRFTTDSGKTIARLIPQDTVANLYKQKYSGTVKVRGRKQLWIEEFNPINGQYLMEGTWYPGDMIEGVVPTNVAPQKPAPVVEEPVKEVVQESVKPTPVVPTIKTSTDAALMIKIFEKCAETGKITPEDLISLMFENINDYMLFIADNFESHLADFIKFGVKTFNK